MNNFPYNTRRTTKMFIIIFSFVFHFYIFWVEDDKFLYFPILTFLILVHRRRRRRWINKNNKKKSNKSTHLSVIRVTFYFYPFRVYIIRNSKTDESIKCLTKRV